MSARYVLSAQAKEDLAAIADALGESGGAYPKLLSEMIRRAREREQ